MPERSQPRGPWWLPRGTRERFRTSGRLQFESLPPIRSRALLCSRSEGLADGPQATVEIRGFTAIAHFFLRSAGSARAQGARTGSSFIGGAAA